MEQIQIIRIPNRKFYKPQILVFDMVTISKCSFCGEDFKDTHPSRKGNKFCCREHFKEYKKIHGCGNKGKTWEETYSPETLKFMKERISKKGKENHNYGRDRPDLLLRNLMRNPMSTEEKNEKIMKMIKENPEATLKILTKKITPNKIYAYQRKAYEFYGKKCSVCGETEGQIDVHHVDKNRKNNKIENLKVLCASCHGRLHKQ